MIKSFFNHDAKARLASVVKRAVPYGVCARFRAGSRYLVVALCVFGMLAVRVVLVCGHEVNESAPFR